MNKELRLLNKKTIVTGGARGIGAGIVKRLYSEGAEIVIADILEKEAKELIKILDPEMKKITFHKIDLSNEDNIISMFEFIKNKWSKLDILINNAGIEDGFLLSDQSYEKYKKVMQINMDAPFLCSK